MFRPDEWVPRLDYLIVGLVSEVQEPGPNDIIVPDSAKEKEESMRAIVSAVGPGLQYESGARKPIDLERGDEVLLLTDQDCVDMGGGYYLVRDHHVISRKKG
jgi:co-chaperonin GroES (HSP10)